MTTVEIYRDADKKIIEYKVYGHSGYAKVGKDIVCAAVSSIMQTAALGLGKVAKIEVKYTIKESYFECLLPQNLDCHKREQADIILETMIIGVKSFEEQYRKYIRIVELEV